MREAPSLVVISKLLEAGATVKAYDPVAMDETKHKIGDKILYAHDPHDAALDADALVLMTEWQEFRALNYKLLAKILKSKVIFDGRNIYEPTEMVEEGFIYYSIGRKVVNP
jgi:UDPglucose 6-dehydrogenase